MIRPLRGIYRRSRKCNSIKDVKKRRKALLKTETNFNLWINIYPNPKSKPLDLNLKIQ